MVVGEKENSPGGERGIGKLAGQTPPPKQMGIEKMARKSKGFKGREEEERGINPTVSINPRCPTAVNSLTEGTGKG